MTRIVDGLVSLGLAERGAHPESARQVLIAPTDAGLDLMHEAAQRRVDVLVAALRSLPTADRRAIVTASPSLRALSSLVPTQAREHAEGRGRR
jgi:DNA-binding MarR family transcriptional regulator